MAQMQFVLPIEVAIALSLLPGYLFTNLLLYFARQTGPANWPNYEKFLASLLGSIVFLTVISTVLETPVIEVVEGRLRLTADPSPEQYLALLIISSISGSVSGVLFTRYYTWRTGLKRRLADPMDYLLKRLETPIPARVVTSERNIVGQVQYTDSETNPVVIFDPWEVVDDGSKTYRIKRGRYAYIRSDDIQSVYFRFDDVSNTLYDSLRDFISSSSGETESENMNSEQRSYRIHTQRVNIRETRLIDGENDKVSASGIIENVLEETLAFVQVRVLFKNNAEAIVAQEYDSIYGLPGGECWQFRVQVSSPESSEVNSIAVVDYTQYV